MHPPPYISFIPSIPFEYNTDLIPMGTSFPLTAPKYRTAACDFSVIDGVSRNLLVEAPVSRRVTIRNWALGALSIALTNFEPGR